MDGISRPCYFGRAKAALCWQFGVEGTQPGDLNSGPCAWAALSLELCPQPCHFFLLPPDTTVWL
jgi:hypothetical protein